MHLDLQDEIEGLFQSLEGKSGDNLDRPLWLSLHDGTDVTRSSRQRTISVRETRMHVYNLFQVSHRTCHVGKLDFKTDKK